MTVEEKSVRRAKKKPREKPAREETPAVYTLIEKLKGFAIYEKKTWCV
jgi:hypothetical protein